MEVSALWKEEQEKTTAMITPTAKGASGFLICFLYNIYFDLGQIYI